MLIALEGLFVSILSPTSRRFLLLEQPGVSPGQGGRSASRVIREWRRSDLRTYPSYTLTALFMSPFSIIREHSPRPVGIRYITLQ